MQPPPRPPLTTESTAQQLLTTLERTVSGLRVRTSTDDTASRVREAALLLDALARKWDLPIRVTTFEPEKES